MTVRASHLLMLISVSVSTVSFGQESRGSEPQETASTSVNAAGQNQPEEKGRSPQDIADQEGEQADPKDSTAADGKEEVLAGHSYHGEAFNEGPRQEAYLMDGLGRVQFPVTTRDPLAQQFVEQGVAQLHGFWYFEAERSFRQAAAIDPDCAMAYWGMAMANVNNAKRAQGFMDEAGKRKDKVTRREKLYIEALSDYVGGDSSKRKERAQAYTKALEKLLYEFPDDMEARAFLALQLWLNRSRGLPITSYLAVDALIGQVLAVEPMHPVHHYRIHLWDYERPETALSSANKCGQSLPAIAHMWHMPGHIYSRLKRYDDASWQQEASARVDHAHMMRDRVMPDQIHNFAHNNEWLIRNLNHVGRVRDAVDLAKNMIELPRHPKYNVVTRRGSTYYGRLRLFETLSLYELWDEMIALCNSPYLEPTDVEEQQIKRLRHVGRAFARQGDHEQAAVQLASLQQRLEEKQQARRKAEDAAREKAEAAAYDQAAIDKAVAAAREAAQNDGADEAAVEKSAAEAESKIRAEQLGKKKKEIDKAVGNAARPFRARIGQLEKAISELEGLAAAADGDFKLAQEKLKKAGGVDAMYLAEIRLQAGESKEALADAEKHVKSNENEVQPLARLIELRWRADDRDAALAAFEQLRAISGPIDLASPVFERLTPIATELGYGEDWRVARPPADDIGDRPPLDSLGPFRWQPMPAPDWTLSDAGGTPISLKHFQGQPVVVIFYLGYGCLHCAEQLHAFSPMVDEFREAGIEMVAISTDDSDGLKVSIDNYDKGKLPIPLLTNDQLDVFKAYRCYDDFESQPLHGTFLIDASGNVRWQDISYEPFMDPKFVLREAQRLLAQ